MKGFCFLGMLLFFAACQPVPPSEQEALQERQAVERQALELEYDRAIRQQRSGEQAPTSMATLTPQRAQALLALVSSDSSRVDTATGPAPHDSALPQHGGVFFTVRDYDQAYDAIQQLAQAGQLRLLSETEQTTDHSRGMLLQLQLPSAQLDPTVEALQGLATVLRKKQRWQPPTSDYHLTVESELVVQQQRLRDLSEQLEATESVAEQLLLQKALADVRQTVAQTVLQLRAQLEAPRQSVLTVAFYEEPTLPAPTPQNFGADLSGNLKAGWIQFKGFVLQAALVWPYLVLALLLLIVVGLVVGNSRRKARQFKLQLLHKQQPVIQPVVVPKPPQM